MTDSETKQLGHCLRLVRVFHDRPAQDVARLVGISPALLSRIESGSSTASNDRALAILRAIVAGRETVSA
jgi:transcriptional regulator with XRE-family HTH domain